MSPLPGSRRGSRQPNVTLFEFTFKIHFRPFCYSAVILVKKNFRWKIGGVPGSHSVGAEITLSCFLKSAPIKWSVLRKKYIVFLVTVGEGGDQPKCTICYNFFKASFNKIWQASALKFGLNSTLLSTISTLPSIFFMSHGSVGFFEGPHLLCRLLHGLVKNLLSFFIQWPHLCRHLWCRLRVVARGMMLELVLIFLHELLMLLLPFWVVEFSRAF